MNREKYLKARRNAIRRCTEPKNNRYQYYGAKGIRCLLSHEDIFWLVKKYKAEEMKKPQLHRAEDNLDYTRENCCFIEASDHSRITHLGAKRSPEARARMSASGGTLYGEAHGCSKLTEAQVKEIRQSPARDLAQKYNVSKSTICAVRQRRIWKWL